MDRRRLRGEPTGSGSRAPALTVLLLGVSYAVLSVGACVTEPESEPDPQTQSSSSAGGAGGEGGALVGQGGQGGDPVLCADDPCKLVSPQCGCDDGERCLLQVGERKCLPEGESEVGFHCDDDCVGGAMCTQVGGIFNPFLCRPYCDSDDDCKTPGGRCVVDVPGGGGHVCSTNCDPITNTGCLEDDMKCDAGQVTGETGWFTFCNGRGDKTQDEGCLNASACDAGHGCFGVEGMGNLCLEWCLNPPNGTCPSGHTCTTFTNPIVVGSVQYGACVPNPF